MAALFLRATSLHGPSNVKRLRACARALASSAAFFASHAACDETQVSTVWLGKACQPSASSTCIDNVDEYLKSSPPLRTLRHTLRKADGPSALGPAAPAELAALQLSDPHVGAYDRVVVSGVEPSSIITTAAAAALLVRPGSGQVFLGAGKEEGSTDYETSLCLQYLTFLVDRISKEKASAGLNSIFAARAALLGLEFPAGAKLDVDRWSRANEEEASWIHYPVGRQAMMDALSQHLSSLSPSQVRQPIAPLYTAEQLSQALKEESQTASLARLTVLRGLLALAPENASAPRLSAKEADELVADRKAALVESMAGSGASRDRRSSALLALMHETVEPEAAVAALKGDVPL